VVSTKQWWIVQFERVEICHNVPMQFFLVFLQVLFQLERLVAKGAFPRSLIRVRGQMPVEGTLLYERHVTKSAFVRFDILMHSHVSRKRPLLVKLFVTSLPWTPVWFTSFSFDAFSSDIVVLQTRLTHSDMIVLSSSVSRMKKHIPPLLMNKKN
jgi:hypothetical protein